MPRARPTAIVSSMAAIIIANSSALSRTTPIGDRVTVVMPLQVDSRTNLVHRSASTVGAGLGLEAGANAGFFERHQARRPRAIALAKHELLRRGVPKVARFVDDDDDVGHAAGDVVGADVPGDHVDGVDAVLQGDDDGVGTNHRLERGRRGVDVVQLHGEQDDVDRADVRGIVGGLHLGKCKAPLGLSMCRPPCCSAARCAPRAMNVTSSPAAASRPPK